MFKLDFLQSHEFQSTRLEIRKKWKHRFLRTDETQKQVGSRILCLSLSNRVMRSWNSALTDEKIREFAQNVNNLFPW